MPQETIVALIQRGDALLALRDIAAARSCYERAAVAGSGAAALAAGRTYDPRYLRDTGALGIAPDAAKAAEWYRKALALGESKAEQRLKALGASTAQ